MRLSTGSRVALALLLGALVVIGATVLSGRENSPMHVAKSTPASKPAPPPLDQNVTADTRTATFALG